MESLRELYRIGAGPSASHTMGPKKAAEMFLKRHPAAVRIRVTLYGSLAATGKGHLTDVALGKVFGNHPFEILWKPDSHLPLHPNGMLFESFDAAGHAPAPWKVYSVGGGALMEENGDRTRKVVYELSKMDNILAWCEREKKTLWEYVEAREGAGIWPYLGEIWTVMRSAIERGLSAEGTLPGVLSLPRKAKRYYAKAREKKGLLQKTGLVSAYALAVSEENASAGEVATAPTCGACGVMPAVLKYLSESLDCPEEKILKALAVGGLVGNLAKTNASISGAEVGCQGEVGVACAMAAASAAYLLGGSLRQMEYAAEMGLEHHLGLTCDPVAGLVQIPCIERNAVASSRAIDCAEYSLLSDGTHFISFDEVVETMKKTGEDMNSSYRETAVGGLAAVKKALNDCG